MRLPWFWARQSEVLKDELLTLDVFCCVLSIPTRETCASTHLDSQHWSWVWGVFCCVIVRVLVAAGFSQDLLGRSSHKDLYTCIRSLRTYTYIPVFPPNKTVTGNTLRNHDFETCTFVDDWGVPISKSVSQHRAGYQTFSPVESPERWGLMGDDHWQLSEAGWYIQDCPWSENLKHC